MADQIQYINTSEELQCPSDMNTNVEGTTNPEATDKSKGTGILVNAANIANNIIGSGIISLPLTFKDSGVGLGIILLSFSAIACLWSLIVINIFAEKFKTNTYEKTVKKIYGKAGYGIIVFCTLFAPLKGAMAFSIVIGDNLTIIFSAFLKNVKELRLKPVVLLVPYFLIIFPLTIPGNLRFLGKFSVLSVILVLYYTIAILYKLNTLPYVIQTLPNAYQFGNLNVIKSLPIFAFSFTVHINSINLYQSLKNRSIQRFQTARNVAYISSIVLYLLVALSGYISFGGQPFGNIFNNYCTDDLLMNITRIIFTISLILTAPTQIFGAREVIIREVFAKWKGKKWLRPLITFILICVIYIVGSTVDNLTFVLEIGSALSNVPIVYIFPALCALKIYGKPYYPSDFKRAISWIVLLFGAIIIVVGPTLTIINTVKTFNIQPIPKYYCNTI